MSKIDYSVSINRFIAFSLSIFVLILSVLGFMMVIALSLAYEHHIMDAIMVFYYWDKMEFYRHPGRPFIFVSVLRRFYEVTTSIFVVLSLFCAFQDGTSSEVSYVHLILLILIFTITLIFIEMVYRCRWKKYFADNWRFKRTLQNDTTGFYRQDWNRQL